MNFLENGQTNDERYFQYFPDIHEKMVRDIADNNYVQEDKRLGRSTQSLSGHLLVLNRGEIRDLAQGTPLSKYEDDWNRMKHGMDFVVAEAFKDPNSRRLMVFNNSDYYNVFQCFTSFHFVMTHRNEYDMYVYQRSSDVLKLKDDLIFFANVAEHFELNVDIPVTKIVISYGHVHYELK